MKKGQACVNRGHRPRQITGKAVTLPGLGAKHDGRGEAPLTAALSPARAWAGAGAGAGAWAWAWASGQSRREISLPAPTTRSTSPTASSRCAPSPSRPRSFRSSLRHWVTSLPPQPSALTCPFPGCRAVRRIWRSRAVRRTVSRGQLAVPAKLPRIELWPGSWPGSDLRAGVQRNASTGERPRQFGWSAGTRGRPLSAQTAGYPFQRI